MGAPRMWLRAATATGIVRFTGSMTPVWIFSEKFKRPPLAHPSRAHATPEASLSGPSVPRTPGEGLPPTSFARHGPGLVRAQRGPEFIHPATVHVIDVPTLDTDGAPPPPVWEAGPPSSSRNGNVDILLSVELVRVVRLTVFVVYRYD